MPSKNKVLIFKDVTNKKLKFQPNIDLANSANTLLKQIVTFTVTSGSVTDNTINDTTSGTTVTGSGAGATFSMVSGVPTAVVDGGSGYAVGDTLTVNGQTITVDLITNKTSGHIVSEADLNLSGNTLKTDNFTFINGNGNYTDVSDIIPNLVNSLDTTSILQLDDLPGIAKTRVFSRRVEAIAGAVADASELRTQVLNSIETELSTFKRDRTDIFRLYATSIFALANVNLSSSASDIGVKDQQASIKDNIIKRHIEYTTYINYLLDNYDQRSMTSDATPVPSADLKNYDEIIAWMNTDTLIDASSINSGSTSTISLGYLPAGSSNYTKSNINSIFEAIASKCKTLNIVTNVHYNASIEYIHQIDQTLHVELDFYINRISNNWLTGTTDDAVSALQDFYKTFEKGTGEIVDVNLSRAAVDLTTQIGDSTITVYPTNKISSLGTSTVNVSGDDNFLDTVGVYVNHTDSSISNFYGSLLAVIYKNTTVDDDNTTDDDYIKNITNTGTLLAQNMSITQDIGGIDMTTPATSDRILVIESSGNLTNFTTSGNYDTTAHADQRVNSEYVTQQLIKTNNDNIQQFRLDVNNQIFDDMIVDMQELGWISYVNQN